MTPKHKHTHTGLTFERMIDNIKKIYSSEKYATDDMKK